MTAPEVDPTAHVRRMAVEGRRLLDARDARADPSEPESESELASRAILGLLEPLIAEVDRLRVENEALRAKNEQGRELIRDLTEHHVHHHEWDKVADKVLDAASALFIAITKEHAARPVSQETLDAAKVYYEASQAAMVDT